MANGWVRPPIGVVWPRLSWRDGVMAVHRLAGPKLRMTRIPSAIALRTHPSLQAGSRRRLSRRRPSGGECQHSGNCSIHRGSSRAGGRSTPRTAPGNADPHAHPAATAPCFASSTGACVHRRLRPPALASAGALRYTAPRAPAPLEAGVWHLREHTHGQCRDDRGRGACASR